MVFAPLKVNHAANDVWIALQLVFQKLEEMTIFPLPSTAYSDGE